MCVNSTYIYLENLEKKDIVNIHMLIQKQPAK